MRRDSVMLHDPMGSHKRATIGGVVLACVGCIGFLVWGLFGGKGSVPDPGSVVIAKESGSVYVVTADDAADKRLIPMLNMASAKLLVMAQGGGGQGQAIEPTTVKEAALAEFPRGPRTGMPNAPEFLPSASDPAPAAWAVCDEADVNGALGQQRAEESAKISTTVMGGVSHHGQPLADDQSLFVQDTASGQQYLVYNVDPDLSGRSSSMHTVKARIDPNEAAVTEMYGLNSAVPRQVSTHMLNAIPEVAPLELPQVPNKGGSSPNLPSGQSIGDVVKQTVPGDAEKYFLLLENGKQQISAGAAAVMHASGTNSTNIDAIPNITGKLPNVNDVPEGIEQLGNFPAKVPNPVPFRDFNSSCLSWVDNGGNHEIRATLHRDGVHTPKAPVELAQSDDSGPNVDHFFMPPGKAAVVHGNTNEAGSGIGPIYFVSDQGVVYGVKDPPTAQGLGVINAPGEIKDAPGWVMRTLPKGDFLDPAQASFVYDSIEVQEGVNRPPQNGNGSAAAGAPAGPAGG